MPKNTFYFNGAAPEGPGWTRVQFGTSMHGIHIINRGSFTLEFSFNGDQVDGSLSPTDYSETRDNIDETEIYLRGVGDDTSAQIEAWRGAR